MLSVNIDLSALKDIANIDEVRNIAEAAAANLALLTQAKVQELASEKLHSRLKMFRDGLSMRQEDSGVWIIHLDEKVAWINDGFEAHSLIPDLLNSPKAKTAADGHKYMIVPFVNSAGRSGPTQTTSYQQDLVGAIKQQLKQAKIPWGKIEKDDQGRPKLGKLHSLNLQTPNKTKEGPGQGWGGIGSPRVGATDIEFLNGASIYQSKGPGGKVERSVITFRIASEKHLGTGRWEHPGLDATHILEGAYQWALEELDRNVMPDIIRQVGELNK